MVRTLYLGNRMMCSLQNPNRGRGKQQKQQLAKHFAESSFNQFVRRWVVDDGDLEYDQTDVKAVLF